MADFSTLQNKLTNLKDARNLLDNFRILYENAKVVQTLIARYQTDPAYKAAVDYVFTVQQRAELAGMIGQVNALLNDWETLHPSVLGFESEAPEEFLT